MTAIGLVTRNAEGFSGNLTTLTVRVRIDITNNPSKASDKHPDYLVFADGNEIGAAWINKSRKNGADYIKLAIAAPEFGPKRLHANLGIAAGQDDPDVFAIIWNPDD